jgi:sialidase-1
MKNYWTAALLLSALCLPARAESPLEHVNVYESHKDGYFAYRIPAIEVAPDGAILAFAEARKNNLLDPGMKDAEIDLVCKRSTDNGRTWSKMEVIEHAGTLWSSANPATVVDRQTNKVWLLYFRCKPDCGSDTARPGTDDAQILARSSDDNGKSWSEPIDLTAISRDMADPQWRVTVIGPGGMIQDRKGRLIAAAWRYAPFAVFAIYSEDHGRTWQRGEMVPDANEKNGNENQVVELSDGQILMDFRRETENWKVGTRGMAESRDGGRTWSAPRPGLSLAPCCCAIERYTLKSAGDDRDRILWTGPKGPNRNNLVARISYDEGQTFPVERLIAEGPAAYSDLAILKDKTAGVLWERDDYTRIAFTRLTREFLDP